MALDKKLGIVSYIGLILLFIFISYRSTVKISPPLGGETITFIFGEDKGKETFYTLGEEHFREDSIAKTDYMVSHIRSIEELILYLNENKQVDPWSRIEIVIHGNTWSGLSTKILDGGERAYPKELLKANLKGKLPRLQERIIDSHTVINIWGCGIGRNPIMNLALDRIFTDRQGYVPQVKASKDFVVFRRLNDNKPASRLSADFWPYFFKRGVRPSDTYIANQLEKQYPNEEKKWVDILQGQSINEGDFNQSFHVPITWTVIFDKKEDRPNVATKKEKMNWIKEQEGLMNRVDEFQIPLEKYNWTVNKIIHKMENGEKVPAIKAIGMSTVLCILEEAQSDFQNEHTYVWENLELL